MEIKKSSVRVFKNYIGQLFTGIIILILISYLFVGVGIKSELDEDFYTRFLIGFTLMLMITSIWYPVAKEKEEFDNKIYKSNRLAYSLLVKKVVDTKNLNGLKNFCDKATILNKNEAIKNKLSKYGIDFSFYEKYKSDFVNLENENLLDNQQKKILKKILLKGVSFKFLCFKFNGYETITHRKIITALDGETTPYSVRNDEKVFDKKMFTTKILTSILLTAGFALIIYDGKGFSIEKLTQIITWCGMIFWNIFTSINNGKKAISVYRNNFYNKLRSLLEEFCGSEFYDNTITWTEPNVSNFYE